METKIKDLIASLDLTQEIINETKLQNQNKIKNDEERNVREWRKQLDYLMNVYNKEQNDDNVDNLLKLLVKNLNKMKLHIQKTIDTIINQHAKDITESNKFI